MVVLPQNVIAKRVLLSPAKCKIDHKNGILSHKMKKYEIQELLECAMTSTTEYIHAQ
jgi:hypothetical protein